MKESEEKLCATLEKKTNYVCHYKLLDLYSKIGVKVENITKVLKFREKKFLEPVNIIFRKYFLMKNLFSVGSLAHKRKARGITRRE